MEMLECEIRSVDVSFSVGSSTRGWYFYQGRVTGYSSSHRDLIPGLPLFKKRVILLDFVTLNTNLANPKS